MRLDGKEGRGPLASLYLSIRLNHLKKNWDETERDVGGRKRRRVRERERVRDENSRWPVLAS